MSQEHVGQPEWQSEWEDFAREVERLAEEERSPSASTAHFRGEQPELGAIGANFDLMIDAEKRVIAGVWSKVKDRTVAREDLPALDKTVGIEIAKMLKAGMSPLEARRTTRSAILSYLKNKSAAIIGRRELDAMQ